MASSSSPSSVPLGVSRIIGTPRNRGSLTRWRNGSRPSWPRPIPAWRSTRLPRSRTAVVEVPDPDPARARRPGPAHPSSHRTRPRSPREYPAAKIWQVSHADARAARARRPARGSRPRCSNRWPRQRPLPGRRLQVDPRPTTLGSGDGPRRAPRRSGARPGLLARPDVGPGVGDQVVDPERLGTARPRRSSRRSTCSRGRRRGWPG